MLVKGAPVSVFHQDTCSTHRAVGQLLHISNARDKLIKEAWRPNKLRCKRKYIFEYPKHTPNNKHVKPEGCETSVKYLGKWLKTWIMLYFGGQNDPEIGLLRPIFNTPLKVAQIDM